MLKTELRKWGSLGGLAAMSFDVINTRKGFVAKFLDCRASVSDIQLDWRFTETPYKSGLISPRTKSSGVCRLRMSANLSPRTSASAGSGREL